MKTVYSFALTVLLIVGSITPVFAIEEPNVQVSTVEELKEAIANASDGDTIQITQTIQVLAPDHIGDSSKSITLCGSDSTETLLQFLGEADTSISVENITIDGEHSANGSKILVGTNGNVLFDSVDWRNCVNLKDQGQGGALCVELGNVTLTGCSFVQCHAKQGGAIYTALGDSTYCSLNNCYFSENSAESLGGAAWVTGTSELEACTFINNSSGYNGGAVGGANIKISNCEFAGNNAELAGALTCFSGAALIENCKFQDNSAHQNGGAIIVDISADATLSGNTISNNHAAESGGGVFLQGSAKMVNNKLYGNTANISGNDLTSQKAVSIVVDDYFSLYENELAAGGYDSMAWYADEEGNRYSSENKTNEFLAGKYNGSDSPLELEDISLVFVMWDSNSAPDQDIPDTETPPDSEDEPDSEEPPVPDESTKPNDGDRPSHSQRPSQPSNNPEKEEENDGLILVCGEATIDNEALDEFLHRLDSNLIQEKVTRGEMASILYTLLTEQSKIALGNCNQTSFPDILDSVYKNEITALTCAGVFCGDSDGHFRPLDNLTFGELLTLLVRFVEVRSEPMSSIVDSQHWAVDAARTAYAYGWIDDIPVDFNASITYGALKTVLVRVATE